MRGLVGVMTRAKFSMPHPAIVCGGPQLLSVIAGLEAGTYPQPDDAIWRGDLPRDLAVRLAKATGATPGQIAEVIAEDDAHARAIAAGMVPFKVERDDQRCTGGREPIERGARAYEDRDGWIWCPLHIPEPEQVNG